MASDAASQAERSARRLLGAFPGWLRSTRGEEAVGLVLDLLPAPDRRLPLRSRVDLVRAGLHARRVGLAPPLLVLGVLFAGQKLETGAVPDRWRPWLLHWLQGRRWRARLVLGRGVAGFAAAFAWGALGDGSSSLLAVAMLAAAVGFLLGFGALVGDVAEGWRVRVLARNGFDATGWPVGHWPVRSPVAATTRVPNLPATTALAAFLVVPSVMAVWATLRWQGAVAGDQRGGADLLRVIPALVVLGLAAVRGAGRLRGAPADAPPLASDRHLALVAVLWLGWAFGANLGADAAAPAVSVGVPTAATLVGLALLAVTGRRERTFGRRVGVWELWPALRGPADRERTSPPDRIPPTSG